MTNIVIIGGHGKVALLAAPLLVEAGNQVTSVIRNPEHADDVAATGATPLVESVEELDTDGLTRVLQGADVVVWSAGAGGGDATRTTAVDRDAAIRSMEAAQAAGVGRYVMVSYYGARPDHGVPADNGFFAYAEAKAEADAHLRASGLDWTIVAPSALTLEEPTGRIDAQVGEGPQGDDPDAGSVSRGNVARVIAAVVDAGGPSRTTIAFTDGETPIAEVIEAAAR
ncbi:SDR family oxidoreductase [Nigerium massiliense]|uniref:SDR family oxidoreductase n=1 Tax=Nigerium massiliense TaxID=1522317 RepID=UPI00058B5C38|nr:SDR family oxidoreductase [Nigerium massiliense]